MSLQRYWRPIGPGGVRLPGPPLPAHWFEAFIRASTRANLARLWASSGLALFPPTFDLATPLNTLLRDPVGDVSAAAARALAHVFASLPPSQKEAVINAARMIPEERRPAAFASVVAASDAALS
jgi:hypothetical protein